MKSFIFLVVEEGKEGTSGRKTIEKYGTEEQKKLVEDYIQKRDNIISIKKDQMQKSDEVLKKVI